MSYEHSLDGRIVVFSDEESYLRCRLEYVDYASQFADDQDHLSFYSYIESHRDDFADWDVENIMQPDDPYTHTLNFSFDPDGDISIDESANSIVGLDSGPVSIANISYAASIEAATSNEMSSQTVTGSDGTILYTTLVPNSAVTTNLNNGWVRTTANYSCSTDSPEMQAKRLKEEEERERLNQFNRFDILDFD